MNGKKCFNFNSHICWGFAVPPWLAGKANEKQRPNGGINGEIETTNKLESVEWLEAATTITTTTSAVTTTT